MPTTITTTFDLAGMFNVLGGQLIVLATAIAVILFDFFIDAENKRFKSGVLGFITAVGFFAAIVFIATVNWNAADIGFMHVFSMEKFSSLLSMIVLGAGILTALVGIGYLRNNDYVKAEFFTLVIFAVYGMITMIGSTDLMMMFIALELMSVSLYVLAGFQKENPKAIESAFKYFLLGSFGSAFVIFGIAIFFGMTGTVNFAAIGNALLQGSKVNPMVLIALALIAAGLFFKMALVPFHMWTPDVYEGSPSVVTGFMATAVKASAFAIFIKVFSVIALMTLKEYWVPVVWIISLLTMLVGNLLAVSQTNIKRMLAYSSIAHAGYLALGLLALDKGGVSAISFYLVAYVLMSIGAFTIVYLVDAREGNAQSLDDYSGIGFRYPTLGFLMALFMFGMAGVPPMAGFVGKFFLFASAIRAGYFGLALMGILTSAIGAYYYIRVVVYLYMKDAPESPKPKGAIDFGSATALFVTAVGVLALGVAPSLLTSVTELAQKSLLLIK